MLSRLVDADHLRSGSPSPVIPEDLGPLTGPAGAGAQSDYDHRGVCQGVRGRGEAGGGISLIASFSDQPRIRWVPIHQTASASLAPRRRPPHPPGRSQDPLAMPIPLNRWYPLSNPPCDWSSTIAIKHRANECGRRWCRATHDKRSSALVNTFFTPDLR
jgi:hypothetical protein